MALTNMACSLKRLEQASSSFSEVKSVMHILCYLQNMYLFNLIEELEFASMKLIQEEVDLILQICDPFLRHILRTSAYNNSDHDNFTLDDL